MTPATIKSGFRRTGIVPFDRERIMQQARESAGTYYVGGLDRVDQMEQRLLGFMNEVQESGTQHDARVDRLRTHLPRTTIVSSEQLLEVYQKRASESEQQQAQRQARYIRRQARRVEHRQQQQDREAYRCKHQCHAEGCASIQRKSKDWLMCEACNLLLCPKHKKQQLPHECQDQGESIDGE